MESLGPLLAEVRSRGLASFRDHGLCEAPGSRKRVPLRVPQGFGVSGLGNFNKVTVTRNPFYLLDTPIMVT